MNKIWLVVKTNFINSFGINKFFKQKTNRSTIVGFLLLLLSGIIVFAFFGIYMYVYGKMFSDNGRPDEVLSMGITLGSIAIIISAITISNSYLFKFNHFDLLMSLPLTSKQILFSRIINLIITNYSIFIYFYLPSVIVYSIFNPTSFIFWVLAILGFFIIPIFPLIICSFISYYLGFIKINEKLKKVLKIIVPTLFTTILFILMIFTNNNSDDFVLNNIFDKLQKYYYPGYFIFLGIKGKILNFSIYSLVSILLLVCFTFFASRKFLKVNALHNYNKVKKDYVLKDVKKSSPLKSLFVKEAKNFFSNSTYVLNTIMGPIFSVIIAIFIIRQRSYEYIKIGEMLLDMRSVLLLLMIADIAISSMATITSSSISLEGKKMWILKSLPVKTSSIFISKIGLNILIVLPFVLINSLISILYLKLKLLEALLLILISLLIVITNSIIGLFINLLYPKLDFEHPTVVIKRSMSVFISLIFTNILIWGLSLISIVCFLITNNCLLAMAIELLIALIACLVSMLLLNKIGTNKFQKIVC